MQKRVMMFCPLHHNDSSPIEYQYYLVTTQGVPLPHSARKKKQTQETKPKKQGPREKKSKKKEKKRDLSLRILPRRSRLLTSLHGKRLARRGLQQQYLMRCSNFVEFMYARNIK